MTALAQVLARPDVWRGDRLAQAPLPALATGFAALDAELPGGGWPRGALTELLVDGQGLGELSLLLPVLAGGGLLVAPPHPLHAPAWAAAGIDLSRLVIVAPASERDALWSLEQALAGGAPRLAVGWAARADAAQVRRLQVAASGGAIPAFLFRPAAAAREASAAPLRLALAAGPAGRLRIDILKRRGPALARPLFLTLPRPAALHRHGTPLAGPASARYSVAVAPA